MSATEPATDTRRETWMADAACRELPPAVFFPTDAVGVTVAQCVCAACPVRDLCLDYALAHRIEHGVWGGASEAERRRMRHPGSGDRPRARAPALHGGRASAPPPPARGPAAR